MTLAPAQLRKLLRHCAHLQPGQARLFLGRLIDVSGPAIQCGARQSAQAALAAQHYARRAPWIAVAHETFARHLDYARAETLRNIEERMTKPRRRTAAAPVQAADGDELLRRGGVAADLVFDLARWRDGLVASLRDFALDVLDAAGAELFAELGRDDAFIMPEPRAVEYLDQRENRLRDVADSVHRAIEEELQRGIEAGDSMAELSRRITTNFEFIDESRGNTIASTETGAAYGFARHEAMKEAGITRHSWLTSHLPTVRAAHAEAEEDARNEALPIDEPFYVGGERLRYPGDEAGSPENVINCHCVEVALPDEA